MPSQMPTDCCIRDYYKNDLQSNLSQYGSNNATNSDIPKQLLCLVPHLHLALALPAGAVQRTEFYHLADVVLLQLGLDYWLDLVVDSAWGFGFVWVVIFDLLGEVMMVRIAFGAGWLNNFRWWFGVEFYDEMLELALHQLPYRHMLTSFILLYLHWLFLRKARRVEVNIEIWASRETIASRTR